MSIKKNPMHTRKAYFYLCIDSLAQPADKVKLVGVLDGEFCRKKGCSSASTTDSVSSNSKVYLTSSVYRHTAIHGTIDDAVERHGERVAIDRRTLRIGKDEIALLELFELPCLRLDVVDGVLDR
jgi:hypothetical protein